MYLFKFRFTLAAVKLDAGRELRLSGLKDPQVINVQTEDQPHRGSLTIGSAASGSPGKIGRNPLSSPENLLERQILRHDSTHSIRNSSGRRDGLVLTSLPGDSEAISSLKTTGLHHTEPSLICPGPTPAQGRKGHGFRKCLQWP